MSELVSVIIPVYNVEKYIRDCLDSVLVQDYPNIEIILVDDGSTDSSGTICDDYRHDNNNVIVFHKVNGGLSSARNFGLCHSHGDKIIFLDPDDMWLFTGFLTEMSNLMDKYNADIVRCEYRRISDSGDMLYTASIDDKKSWANRPISSYQMLSKVMNNEYFTCLFMLKRSIVETYPFNESQKFQEDVDFAIRLFTQNHICVYSQLQAYAYRQRKGSIVSSMKADSYVGSLKLIDTFIKYSEITSDSNIRDYYYKSSVKKYYRTLASIAAVSKISDRKELLHIIDFNSYRKNAIKLCFNKHILIKETISLFLPPFLCVFFVQLLSLLNKKHNVNKTG